MPGQCVARFAIHQEPDLGNLRQVRMQCADDGQQCHRLRLDAARMHLCQAATQIDDRHRTRQAITGNGHRHQEDVIDPCILRDCMECIRLRILRQQLVKQEARTRIRLVRQLNVLLERRKRAIVIIGNHQGHRRDRRRIGRAQRYPLHRRQQPILRLLMQSDEIGRHDRRRQQQHPEKDFLIAGNHWASSRSGDQSCCHSSIAAAIALTTFF